MNTGAANFEYEWMADGSLRLRFLSRDDDILGQDMVAAEGVQALQLLLVLALAKTAKVEPEKIMAMLQSAKLDVDPDFLIEVLEAVRVRTGITPEGTLGR